MVAISGIVEALLMQTVRVFEEEQPISASQTTRQPRLFPRPHTVQNSCRTCPGCGAPNGGQDVKWTGPQSADCPFCGSNLPMQKTDPCHNTALKNSIAFANLSRVSLPNRYFGMSVELCCLLYGWETQTLLIQCRSYL
ncbi:MAG: hypothetical protein MZU97_08300 [Bacillus subtilis]|nr:hypothetical protein [Bacillus subtilis]